MIIDLSVELNRDTPVYPGDPAISIMQTGSYAEQGYMGHTIHLGTHSGTHIDAPSHMLADSPMLGGLPLDIFAGSGKLVRGFFIDAIELAGISANDIVLFDTGTARRFYKPSYFTDYPVLTEELVDYLIRKRVKLVGLDTCSADNISDFPIHRKLLGANIPIIENLTNLSGLHGKTFRVYALPLKINADGAPARVVAELQDA